MREEDKQLNNNYYADEAGFVVDLKKKVEDDKKKEAMENSLQKEKKSFLSFFRNNEKSEVKNNVEKNNKEENKTINKEENKRANKEDKNEKVIKKEQEKEKKKNKEHEKEKNKEHRKEERVKNKEHRKDKKKKKNNNFFNLFKKKKSISLYKLFTELEERERFKKMYKKRIKGINKKIKLEQRKFLIKPKHKKKSLFEFSNPILSFVLILLFLIVPIKLLHSFNFFDFKGLEDKIMNYSYGAIENLEEAGSSVSKLNLNSASKEFEKASLSFLEAEKDLEELNKVIFKLASLSSNSKIKLAAHSKNILKSGKLASDLGASLVKATDYLFSGNDFSSSLNSFLEEAKTSAKLATDLNSVLSQIPVEDLPVEYRDKFFNLKKQSSFILQNINKFIYSADNLKEVLGLSMDKRYLLVFQNNAELRASGGFLGSYALIDVRDGKIRNLEVPAGGSYDLEAGLQGKKIVSPEPLHLVNPHWNFWDANWWPDWPKTARHLMWFYSESGGPTVDGVISLTPTVVESALKITGPIDMREEYGVIVTSDNFWQLTQKTVEYDNLAKEDPSFVKDISNPDIASTTIVEGSSFSLKQGLEENKENKPKKIIGDLMAKILEELPKTLNRENLPEIASLLSESVLEKHLMLYFSDEKLQAEIEKLKIAGEIKKTENDYLMIVDTNIGGRKSDRILKRKANLETEILNDGSILNTLTLEYAHPGKEGDPLVDVRNVNWLRVYVPNGSELINANGFESPDNDLFEDPNDYAILLDDLASEREADIDLYSDTKIYNDSDKTVFANWVMTDPGEKNEVVIKYKLPFNINDLKEKASNDTWLKQINFKLNPDQEIIFPYTLLVQKQPGVRPYPFEAKFKEQNGYLAFWQGSDKIKEKGYIWNYLSELDSDKFISVILK
ncbi:MAG: DUF4012 domain-containing protein [Patescibacteria group bacterium]|jgi:hypothetical protein|nr:DUF4012 domain-containing protein [Patescibacteria group bacterium]